VLARFGKSFSRVLDCIIGTFPKNPGTQQANDPTILISKFDKGNGVAVLNKIDYEEKMNLILNDKSKFVPLANDDNIIKLEQFQRCLRYLKKKGSLTNEEYQRIYPTSTSMPTLYGLLKVHK